MDSDISRAPALDAQFAGIIEEVWACERQWALDARIDACIKYSGASERLDGKQDR